MVILCLPQTKLITLSWLRVTPTTLLIVYVAWSICTGFRQVWDVLTHSLMGVCLRETSLFIGRGYIFIMIMIMIIMIISSSSTNTIIIIIIHHHHHHHPSSSSSSSSLSSSSIIIIHHHHHHHHHPSSSSSSSIIIINITIIIIIIIIIWSEQNRYGISCKQYKIHLGAMFIF